MFVLTFAVGSRTPRAQELAMKIARHILFVHRDSDGQDTEWRYSIAT
jgi:hypothetical protein